ncbi:universal stress protein [Peribacillus kribbensis]|uniref:universal stress protein n=1 Tax=Peribacillus kribbensis TaxID=356658 RepID=UPI0003FA4328|nr:universal stress protein [Peribacillus kribbensis]
MYQRILLAADGSKNSKRAAEHAIHLANGSAGSAIEIVYVIEPDQVRTDVLNNWNTKDIQDARKERISEIEQLAADAGVPVTINILHGSPGPCLVDFAHKNKVDLVVIGSRGLNRFQEFVLGSVSHKVAKRAACPVLIVK